MEYQVLARKYRPKKLSELIGQEVLVKTLTNAIKQDRVPHAFVLTGIRGVGKTSTARIIARSLLCTGVDGKSDKPTTEPCGVCANCKAISEDNHIDVIEIDAASKTGVNDIREIIDQVAYAPVLGRNKIYIIDEVHMLSKSAFNALLKTLEEPPEHIKFIFATTEVRKIPVTIISRCMRFDLPRVQSELLVDHFENIAKQEGAEVDNEALNLIASASEGSVRDGISLLDQAIAISSDGKINAEKIVQMLGLADRIKIYDLAQACIEGEAEKGLEILQEIHNQGVEALTILKDLLVVIHKLTLYKTTPNLFSSKFLTEFEEKKVKEIIKTSSVSELARLWQIINKGIEDTNICPIHIMAAEMVIIKATYSANQPTVDKIIKKLETEDFQEEPNTSPNTSTDLFAEKKTLNSSKPDIKTLEDIISLLKNNDENIFAAFLEDAKIISFSSEEKRADLQAENINTGLINLKTLNQKVTALTAEAWQINLSQATNSDNSPEVKSINDLKTEAKQQKLTTATNSNFVNKVKANFPGAKVIGAEEVRG